MKWLELHIDTNHSGLETVEALLSSLDIDGLVIDDEEEFQDFLENNRQYWDYVDEDLEKAMRGRSRVTFYLPADETGFAKMGEVRIALEVLKQQRTDCGTLLMTLGVSEDADWENNWKQYYKPMEIGERAAGDPPVAPGGPQGENAALQGRVPLILDPASPSHRAATHHPAVPGPLWSSTYPRRRAGAGPGLRSGILSIAALRLGAASAAATDIDDKCLTVAYYNAALNGIGAGTYTVLVGDVLSDDAFRARVGGGYQIVVANIVADVIKALAPMVRFLLAPGGLFLCSGIIDDRAEEVAAALTAAGLDILETRDAEGWFSYLCR
jgi:ribosomal protein L11 methyltransferase